MTYLPAPEVDTTLNGLRELIDRHLQNHPALADALAAAYDSISQATVDEWPIWEFADHYRAWAARFVPEDEQESVAVAIHRLLREDPTLSSDHSWTQLRWLAAFGPDAPKEFGPEVLP
jgi:hypothetical protein